VRITHELGQWISLTDDNGIERLRYDYASAPKPFVHPLRLPDGTIITEYEPADHIWHRGLWFAFKFVNGINYWEERDEVFGEQKTPEPPLIHEKPDGTLIENVCIWNDQGIMRLREHRLWGSMLKGDIQRIFWSTSLEAQEEITLDRTPFTTWGGYGGLFVRLKNDLENPRLVFDDGTVTTRCTGERYKWGGIEGTTVNGKDCAVVFIPSQFNESSPEPFYGAAKTDYNFFGPAPLFHEPLALHEGDIATYKYTVLVLPRRINPDEINTYL
jgi:hypothetical protein